MPKDDLQEYKKYLAIHFTNQTVGADSYASHGTAASSVDLEQYVSLTGIANVNSSLFLLLGQVLCQICNVQSIWNGQESVYQASS